jgi:hypothetical protein
MIGCVGMHGFGKANSGFQEDRTKAQSLGQMELPSNSSVPSIQQ